MDVDGGVGGTLRKYLKNSKPGSDHPEEAAELGLRWCQLPGEIHKKFESPVATRAVGIVLKEQNASFSCSFIGKGAVVSVISMF